MNESKLTEHTHHHAAETPKTSPVIAVIALDCPLPSSPVISRAPKLESAAVSYDFGPSPVTNPLPSSPLGRNSFQPSILSRSSLVITSQPSSRRCRTASISAIAAILPQSLFKHFSMVHSTSSQTYTSGRCIWVIWLTHFACLGIEEQTSEALCIILFPSLFWRANKWRSLLAITISGEICNKF